MSHLFCTECLGSIGSKNFYHCLDCDKKDINYCENCEFSQLYKHNNQHRLMKCAGLSSLWTSFDKAVFFQRLCTRFLTQQLEKGQKLLQEKNFKEALQHIGNGIASCKEVIEKHQNLIDLENECNEKLNKTDTQGAQKKIHQNDNNATSNEGKGVNNSNGKPNSNNNNNNKNQTNKKYDNNPNNKNKNNANKKQDNKENQQHYYTRSNKNESEKEYKLGEASFQNYEIKEAVKHFEKSLNQDKFHASSEYYLAKTKYLEEDLQKAQGFLNSENYDEAMKIYEIILKLYPENNNNRIKLKQAECFILQQKMEEADKILKLVANGKVKTIYYYYVKGLYFYYQGEMYEAIQEFKQAKDKDKDHPKALKMLEKSKQLQSLKEKANELFRNSDYEGALTMYTYAISKSASLDKKNHIFQSVLYYNRALTNSKKNDKIACIKDCECALNLNPKYFKALKLRAEMYKSLNRLDDSLSDYKNAIEISSNAKTRQIAEQIEREIKANKLCSDAEKLYGNGKINEAIKMSHEVLKLNSEHALAKQYLQNGNEIMRHIYSAQENFNSKRFEEALNIYDYILSIVPISFQNKIKIWQAACYFNLQKVEELEKVSKSFWEQCTPEHSFVKGLISYYKGDLEDAKQYLKQAKEFWNEDEKKILLDMITKCDIFIEFHTNAISLLDKGLYPEAINSLSNSIDSIRKIYPCNKFFMSILFYLRALANFKINNTSHLCIEDCSKALDFNAKYLEAIMLRAQIYAENNEFSKAVIDYKVAVAISDCKEIRELLFTTERKVESMKYFELAVQAYYSGKLDISFDLIKKSLEHNPQNICAEQLYDEIRHFKKTIYKADKYIDSKRFAEALTMYSKFKERYPNSNCQLLKTEEAKCYIFLQKFELAANILNSITGAFRNTDEYYYVYGLYFYYLGDIKNSKNNFEQINYYKDSSTIIAKCEILENLKEKLHYGQKSNCYEEFLKVYYNDDHIKIRSNDNIFKSYTYFYCAYFYFMKKNYIECGRCCRRALTLNPLLAKALVLRGYAYKISGQFDECLRDYNNALEMSNDEVISILLFQVQDEMSQRMSETRVVHILPQEIENKLKPYIHNIGGELELVCYENIINLEHTDINNNLKIKLAECYIYINEIDKAEKILKSVPSAAQKTFDFIYCQGLQLYYQGSIEKAKEEFDKAYPLPGNYKICLKIVEKCREIILHRYLEERSFESKHFDKAIKHCTDILEICLGYNDNNYANLSDLYYKRGRSHLMINNKEACIADCTTALKYNSKLFVALECRAKAYRDLDNFEECVQDCNTALKLGDSEEVKNMLSEVELKLKH